MKKILLIPLLCFSLGCATMRRHPALTGIVAGAAVGVTIGIATHHSCPSRIDGVPYNGTYPCPKSCEKLGDCYWDPGKK